MATPVVTNRSPAFGTRVGVGESTRFSVRPSDGEEILRDTIQFYLGSGPAFYEGGMLPEEHESVQFRLVSPFPNPDGLAERSIEPDDSLKIVKGTGTLAAVYEFGGEQAPADPAATLMAEFTLSLAEADVTVDGNDFTGVIFGLKSGDTGVQIKFFSDGGSRWIEIHHAELTTIAAPGPAYVAAYDWDQGMSHTYKLLWDERNDKLKLYVSSGPLSDDTDEILVDGAVSDFATPLPDGQIPSFVPLAYFGHGYITPESTSYWHDAYLHNIVSQAIVSGIARGEHVGFIHTDDVVKYECEELPRKTDKPWTILPDSFGTIEGFEEISIDEKLVLVRSAPGTTYGFYRVEPSILLDTYTILDFKISGLLRELDPNEGQASGIEVYLDDGTKQAVFALLSNAGTQSVGLLTGTNPHIESSYVAQLSSWVNEATYRIIFRKNETIRLLRLIPTDEGVAEEAVVSAPYSALPASGYPGPGLGFLINGNTIPSHVEMRVGGVRYATNVQRVGGPDYPLPAGWTEVGTGSVSSDGVYLHIDDDTDSDTISVQQTPTKLDSGNGFFVECRCKIDSYEYDGEESPIRRTSGAGFVVDDATYRYAVIFADAGPTLGKIVFISMEDDYEENLFKIRSGDASVVGTYTIVDWTEFHMYRLEKTTGGLVQLFIDNEDTPVISHEQASFQPASTLGSKKVYFGGVSNLHESVSLWEYFSYGVSMGFDISAFPVLSENEILSRFSHAFNVIVEGANGP